MLRFEHITYKHSGNCYRFLSDQIELLITVDIGRHIIRVGFINGDNDFAEVGFSLDIPVPVFISGYPNARHKDGFRPDDAAHRPTTEGERMIALMGGSRREAERCRLDFRDTV